MEFGERIKERRQKLKLTQAKVAKRLFVTRQAISNWEHGKTYPDLNKLVKVSDVYQISIDSLLKEDQNLKNYLEQGKAFNAFSVLSGFIWIILGLGCFVDVPTSREGQIAWNVITVVIVIAIIYEQFITPFFLGMSQRMYYKGKQRPGQRLSLLAKVIYFLIVLDMIIGVYFVHQGMPERYFSSPWLILVGIQNILQKYMWKQDPKLGNKNR
ncbi:helix-turn-helix transcriptional regulator [Limosilactobacillus sp. Sa3CUN2]|uniref:Helix-turn-helix transcriptional regulator n=1 Tax=Limosilactobacillus avistercoris TaxID=2762243 RepID=A0ABR8PD58_9LACO|nr:helix-turn-helix transcriptional regulator [Limosilactobacillus avistercoris]MBD7895233.1 helix-turn-helix transcriptional regulator [Limosilactobacillus avistercoris]